MYLTERFSCLLLLSPPYQPRSGSKGGSKRAMRTSCFLSRKRVGMRVGNVRLVSVFLADTTLAVFLCRAASVATALNEDMVHRLEALWEKLAVPSLQRFDFMCKYVRAPSPHALCLLGTQSHQNMTLCPV